MMLYQENWNVEQRMLNVELWNWYWTWNVEQRILNFEIDIVIVIVIDIKVKPYKKYKEI